MKALPIGQVKAIQRNADKGIAAAQLCLGEIYATGNGLAIDSKEAVIWFERAANQGNIKAQIKLSNIFWKGTGVPKNPAASYAWAMIATECGCSNWSHRLASFWIKKALTPEDLDTANQFVSDWQQKLRQAAKLNPSLDQQCHYLTPRPGHTYLYGLYGSLITLASSITVFFEGGTSYMHDLYASAIVAIWTIIRFRKEKRRNK